MLAVLVANAGGDVGRRSTSRTIRPRTRAALARGLEGDILVTSGGVSVGPHDLVRDTLGRLGVVEAFWGVAMRPGKPLSFGTRDRTLVFGLPGNPVSSLVGALLFLLPAIRALQGHRRPEPQFGVAMLAAPAGPPTLARRLPARNGRAIGRRRPAHIRSRGRSRT